MDHPDRKPRCTTGGHRKPISIALYGLSVCHFAVYSDCVSVSFRKEDNLCSPEVHRTGGSRRVFRQFSWLGAGSVKVALSRPAHQYPARFVRGITPNVRRLCQAKNKSITVEGCI